ncbi:MAG: oligosaccharide flippase family protein [Synergistota bacterium]|nr:oligosaccharide flippase family protein [Synergistota bacterium]
MQILNKYINKIKKSNSALKDVSFVAGGTVISQAIGILVLPVLSRIYTPADFGIAAVFASAITILSHISGLRYYLAIPLPKSDRYANAVIVLSLLVQFIFSLVLCLLLIATDLNFFTKIRLENLYQYRYLVPIGVFLISLYVTLTQWAIRTKSFSTIGKTKISQSITGNVAKVILGLLNIKPLGLLLGEIMSRASGITTLYKGIVSIKGVPKTTRQDIVKVALKYRNFPLFDIWTALLNTAGYHIVPYLILIFYDSQTTGYFSMAFTLMAVPGALIGTAIGQVFLQKAASAQHSGNLKELTFKAYLVLLRLSLFPILLLSIMSPLIFSVVLGKQWADAGIYAMLLGPWVMIMFIQSPLSNVFSILGLQRQALVLEIVYSASRIAAFLFGTLWKDARIAILFLSLSGFFITIIRLWYVLISSGNNTNYIIKKTFPVIIETTVLAFFPLLLYFNNSEFYLIVLTAIITLLIFLYRNFILSKINL